MDMQWNELGQSSSPFFLFPASPAALDDEPIDTRLPTTYLNLSSPTNTPYTDLLLSPTCDDEHNPSNISNTLPFSPVSSSNSSEEYLMSSFDELTPPLNVPIYTTDLSTPQSEPSEKSVTSRLKAVLMSRKEMKRHDSVDSPRTNVQSHSPENRYKRKICEPTNGLNEALPSALKFPPCFVCGGNASGLHYGVNTCEPCKGFFTRYLRKREEYKCAKTGNCRITNQLRGNCSACRLEKCRALGMSRKNSRLGRYSLTRRMETIRQVNQLEKHTHDTCTTHVHCESNESVVKTTNAHLLHIQTLNNRKQQFCKPKAANGFSNKLLKALVDYMDKIKPYGEDLVTPDQILNKLKSHYETYKLKIELFGQLTTIPKDEYFNLLKEFGIEIDHRMMVLKQSANEIMDVIERYCNFAKQIPNFKLLSNNDQSKLLKSSRYDFFMILMHEGYLHDQQVFLAHNGVAFHREEVADKFFSRELVLAVCDMYHRLQTLKLSKEEKALLIAISLVFTDRCNLENPKLVEKIQFSLTQLLRNQLDKTCKDSSLMRFTKIIDCLTRMRESSELYLKEYSELCQDEMVIEEVPIMTELLFEEN